VDFLDLSHWGYVVQKDVEPNGNTVFPVVILEAGPLVLQLT
jgi:hypothetical protein